LAIEHLRNLAKYGVIADGDAYNIPSEAFSAATNVRFRNGKITGGPVFRNVLQLGTIDPRFTFASNPAQGLDLLFTGYKNGKVSKISGTTETDYSISGYSTSSVEATWSNTTLAGVTYVNRSDRAPWYLRTSDTQFQNLGVVAGSPASWDSTWTCALLRSCAGALVALNVTKGSTAYPTMVKTSSIPTSGVIPSSWDQSVPATLAVENILAEMQGPIIDGCKLGNDLIIYGFKEAWIMQANGQTSVYNFLPLPFKKGALNANCSVEWDGKNVVFGPDDIWLHDGTSEKSIADGRVKDFIFNSINLSKSNRCFVKLNPRLKEITFAFVSGDQYTNFSSALVDGCNKQAVWNYIDDTWTFDDLPSVFSATEANLTTSLTYTSVASTYDTIGGSYQDQEDGFKRTSVYVGSINSTYGLATSLYAHDLFGQGSTVSYSVDLNATKPRYLERDGLDLDELNEDLRDYKLLRSIYPQARLGSSAANLLVAAGASDSFNVQASISPYQPYNGVDLYKCDFNVAGRFLSYRIQFNDYKELTITGLDCDLKRTAKR
jgi:hypothetical protein